ncbi:MAG: SDR family oxidoreductase [Kofleriaceae bacterium]|nr:MAG: SDR family oxidoreductase [Kofleriaceae bacterium]MBZ0231891.1 SDR family oxidoreductase [Kofleriaceae bacterium]
MTTLFDNKVALVTGAGSGIGRDIAFQLAREGARVVVSDINDAGGAETVAHIRERGGTAVYQRADTSKPGDNEALVAAAIEQLGGLHIAVNNAGIGGPQAPAGEYPIDGWDKVIAINLSGVFYGMRYQLPAMLRAGGGSIINIASVLGQVGFRNSAAYVAAKHGVVGLTRAAALEYGPQKVRVNAVGPGFIRTPLVEKSLSPEALRALEGQHAMNRLGESTEVAELVTWLASDRASFVTGGYYAVDGGYLAQ